MICRDDETIKAILDTAEKFADRELRESVYEHDEYPYGDYARGAMKGAFDAGLTMLAAPEDFGGVGLPAGVWALVLEKVAEVDAGFAAGLLAHALAVEALAGGGSAEIRDAFLGSGSEDPLAYPLYLQADDPQGIPSAIKDGGGYVLSGLARMVANAPAAKLAVVAADLEGEVALFAAELGDELRPAPSEMLGLRSCPVGHVDFVDLKVTAGALLMAGEKSLEALHGKFMAAAAGISLGTLKASMDYAIEYGMERFQGGKMIHEHSGLRAMYGTMAAERLALRQAMIQAAGNGAGLDEAMAVKILAADVSIRSAMDGVQLLGGYGYTQEYPQERRLRDARQAAEILGSPSRLRLTIVDGLIGKQ